MRRTKPFPVERLNAWRMHRQWLDRPFRGRGLVDLIRSVGWIYSPGGSTPYVSLWARMSGFRPSTLDRSVFEERTLVPLDTLRGNTMLVPVEDVPIALRIRARTFTDLAAQAEDMLPLARPEMDRLKSAVLGCLESGPKTETTIRDGVPSGLVREFPSTLRRIGMTGSLRLAIHLLGEEGRIVKVQTDGRLDTPDHEFALLTSLLPEVDAFELKPEPAGAALAARYFATEGPARVKDFAWWSGLHVTDAMRAAEAVEPKLERVAIAGSPDEFLIPAPQLQELVDFKPKSPVVNLIPFRDVFLKGQREIASRFMRPEHAEKPFARLGGRMLRDPMATVLCDGEVVGIWEWDASGGGALDFVLFEDGFPSDARSLIEKRAARLARFIKNDLGEIRGPSNGLASSPSTGIRDLQATWDAPRVANAPSA